MAFFEAGVGFESSSNRQCSHQDAYHAATGEAYQDLEYPKEFIEIEADPSSEHGTQDWGEIEYKISNGLHALCSYVSV
jgi:hypothetical protein